MNDEIKEMNLSEMLFNRDERLLDCITNLQEENRQTKLLKERYQLEKETYKSRNEKAVEYINSCTWSNGIDKEIQYSLHVPTLLNILGDKE
jgi:hypothetical protein